MPDLVHFVNDPLGIRTWLSSEIPVIQPKQSVTAPPGLETSVSKGELSRILRAIRQASSWDLLNKRTRDKYGGLDDNAPAPTLDLSGPEWDFWEWWAGEAGVTKHVIKLSLIHI